jgi:hypothetical protein
MTCLELRREAGRGWVRGERGKRVREECRGEK